MKAIWKFTLHGPKQKVDMPKGAQILSLQTQHNEPTIWALVDEHAENESRVFISVPTGARFDPEDGAYLGTVQMNGGSLVFHIYETTALLSARQAISFRWDLPRIDLLGSIKDVRAVAGQEGVDKFIDEWRRRGHLECSDEDAERLKKHGAGNSAESRTK